MLQLFSWKIVTVANDPNENKEKQKKTKTNKHENLRESQNPE